MEQEERKMLAWHETMELHELVASQSLGLMKLKMSFAKVPDKELKELYRRCIRELEGNLNALLKFYPSAPGQEGRTEEQDADLREDAAFYAGELLVLSKTLVRNLSIAVTETITPGLKRVLTNHLNAAVAGHERISTYLLNHGYYPSYDLGKLLGLDISNAHKAIRMDY